MSLVSMPIFKFWAKLLVVILIRNDFRSVDFDVGIPLPEIPHSRRLKPVTLNVDNGQTAKKHQVTCFRVCVYGNSATGKGARWVWMRLAGPAVSEVTTFEQG